MKTAFSLLFFIALPLFAQQEKQSYLPVYLSDSCDQKIGSGSGAIQGGRWTEAYNKLRDYIEVCYYDLNAYSAFSLLVVANQNRSNTLNRYPEHREWLKKVLYYNLDTLYYCADVGSMIKTMIWFDSTRGVDYAGSIAIAKYIVESGKCKPFNQTFLEDINADFEHWYIRWQDSVQDPNQTPFDSTLPSLEDLDLSILRGKNNVTQPKGNYSKQVVSNFTAETNPFSDVTVLQFILNEAAFVKIELFDILGKRLDGYGGRLFVEGKNSISIDGKQLPSGVLYARLTTLSGEVRTIHLRHY